MRKGDTIGGFLKAVREQLAPQFRELRAVSVDNMMYIKVQCAGAHAHALEHHSHVPGLFAWHHQLPLLTAPLRCCLSPVHCSCALRVLRHDAVSAWG